MISLVFYFWLGLANATNSENQNEIQTLRKCVEDLNTEVEKYQSGMSHLTWKFDTQILADVDLLQGLKSTLTWTSNKNPDSIVDVGTSHLLGNAYQSCVSARDDFSQRAKRNFWLCYLMAPGIFVLVLVIGLISAWGSRKQLRTKFGEDTRSIKWLALMFCVALYSVKLRADSLSVYTYDALTGKGSLGEILKREFKSKTGAELNLVSFSSEGEALNQIVIEGQSTKADILLGIDSSFASRAESTNLFNPVPEKYFSQLEKFLEVGTSKTFLPFDFGYLAFLYDKTRTSVDEKKWGNMTLQKFIELESIRKKIVIEDPRTSSIGFSFLRWTQEYFKGSSNLDLAWKKLFPKLITVSPSWSGAYGMFLKGEADWVLSYTTSRAYHLEREKKEQYDFLFFEDGHLIQVEGVGLVKFSPKKSLIESFLEILMSEKVQSQIPLVQWMYPARARLNLPDSFKSLRKPKPVYLSRTLSEKDRKKLLDEWNQWGISSP